MVDLTLKPATLRQLRALATVLRAGTMSAAAEILHVTPPAITLQLQQLQQMVGLPLVERREGRNIATEAGQALVNAIEQIEALIDGCDAVLAGLRGATQGTVAVGVVSTAKYFAPQALGAFRDRHPEIVLKLTVGNRSDIVAGLDHCDIDVAIMGRPPKEQDVQADVIGDHPHLIIVPPDHRLAGRRRVTPEQLAQETFLVREMGSGTRSLMERFFAQTGIDPPIGMEIGSNETIKQAVIARLGIAFISGHTVQAELADGRIRALDVKGLPIMRQWHVVHRRDRLLLPAAQAMIAFLVEDGGRFLPRLTPPDPA